MNSFNFTRYKIVSDYHLSQMEGGIIIERMDYHMNWVKYHGYFYDRFSDDYAGPILNDFGMKFPTMFKSFKKK